MSGGPGRYTFGHVESVLRSHRWRTISNSAAYLKPHLKPETRLLDVGCGPGSITAEFAGVCCKGHVVGLDAAREIISKAEAAYPCSKHPNLSFVTGNVFQLPFDNDSFDVVVAHQLLHHVSDQVAALKEMRRVCVKGGVVCCREADYSTCVWAPPSKSLDSVNQVLALLVAKNGGDPLAGQRLLFFAQKAGFELISPSASAWCFATEADRKWWGELWAARLMTGPQADQMRRDLRIAESDIENMVNALRNWATNKCGWYTTTFGEVVCHV